MNYWMLWNTQDLCHYSYAVHTAALSTASPLYSHFLSHVTLLHVSSLFTIYCHAIFLCKFSSLHLLLVAQRSGTYHTVFFEKFRHICITVYKTQVFVLHNSFIEAAQFVPLSHKPYGMIHLWSLMITTSAASAVSGILIYDQLYCNNEEHQHCRLHH